MPLINVRQLSINPGGKLPATSFTDSLQRVSNSDLGPNWTQNHFTTTPIVDPINSGIVSIGAQIDAQQGLNVSSIGNNNPSTEWPNGAFAQVARIATTGKNQFVQGTFINHTGPSDIGGVAILINDQTGDCYFLGSGTLVANHLRLTRVNQTTAVLLNDYGAGIFLAGDVLRLSADLSVGGQVTLQATRNGGALAPFVDNTGSRLTSGYAGGFYFQVMQQSGGVVSTQQWRNFSCGIGL